MSAGEAIESVYFMPEPGKTERIEVPEGIPSAARFTAPRAKVWFFSTPPHDTMDISPEEAVTVDFTGGTARYLVIFFGRGVLEDAVAIPDAAPDFPAGAYLVVNRSGLPIRGEIADQRFELAEGKELLVRPEVGDGKMFGVKFHHQAPPSPDWHRFVSNGWAMRSEQHVIVLLLPPAVNQSFPRLLVRAKRP